MQVNMKNTRDKYGTTTTVTTLLLFLLLLLTVHAPDGHRARGYVPRCVLRISPRLRWLDVLCLDARKSEAKRS